MNGFDDFFPSLEGKIEGNCESIMNVKRKIDEFLD